MNELIKLSNVVIAEEEVQTVNARELHAFLEVGDHFRNWIRNRIEEYDFVENQDYISFAENPAKPQGGRPSKEYAITLDMAKELSMVERNDKGRQARKYFIECEKQLKQKSPQQPVGVLEDKMRALAFAISHTTLSPVARETLLLTTAETVTGTPIPYRPKLERKTFSASEIGARLGVSANKVGRLANLYGLKTDQYGVRVLDKSRHSAKQVETFRYYPEILPVLRQVLDTEQAA